MNKDIFPTSIQELASYLVRAVAWLTANASRLGISPTTMTELNDIYGTETTPNTYLFCKKAYDNAPPRKDSNVTGNLATQSDLIKTKLRQIYNDIPASKWTNEDRNNLNRKTGLPHTPTHHTVPISSPCFIDVETNPNCLIKGGARSDSEARVYAIPETAKELEIRYAIVQGKFPIPDDMKDKVKVSCIGPNDGTTSVIFTKATFQIQLDEIFAGYNFYCWGRWIDIKHPELAGEWSERHILPLL